MAPIHSLIVSAYAIYLTSSLFLSVYAEVYGNFDDLPDPALIAKMREKPIYRRMNISASNPALIHMDYLSR